MTKQRNALLDLNKNSDIIGVKPDRENDVLVWTRLIMLLKEHDFE